MKIVKIVFGLLISLHVVFFLVVKVSAQDIASTRKLDDNKKFEAIFSAKELASAPVKLMPYPRKVKWENKAIELSGIRIVSQQNLPETTNNELLQVFAEKDLKILQKANFSIRFSEDKKLAAEAYNMEVRKSEIAISAANETGYFYALQTLRQLIVKENSQCTLQLCTIKDAPAFPIRGYMIDVGRNFQSIALLKKQIDLLAKYKMNTFHWHLTDRPAWRIESKLYPELTAAENHRETRNPGQFYTYNEIREIIRYANAKQINVIPEIDMPGHSDSFRKSMGCRMESPEGMVILENVLNEFFEEIPRELAPIIHIGSDEVHIKNPKEFITKMVGIVENNGRKVIIWSPGLEANNSVIRQTWGSADAVQGDFWEIDSRKSYINAGEPMSFINTLFFKPIGAFSENKIMGGIICFWPDVNLVHEEDAFFQNPAYSSILTYAWTTWTADIQSAPSKYMVQLPAQGTEALEYFKAYESFLLNHRQRFFQDEPFFYQEQSESTWKLIGPFDKNDGDAILKDNEKEKYKYKSKELLWRPVTGNTLLIKHRWMRDGIYPDAKHEQAVYALTYIYSDEDKEIEAWINFETPMRANRVYTGIAQNGEWDINGGSIYINDTKLPGPQWDRPGWKTKKQSGWGSKEEQEMPWTKEELYWTREPAKVNLNKGWNKVFVKIPCTSKFQNWMFTFAPLDMEGIRFSTEPNN